MLGASVEKAKAESMRKELASLGLVDKTHAIAEDEGRVVIPLVSGPPGHVVEAHSATLIDRRFTERTARKDPIDDILAIVQIPESLKPALPRKWELFGDVLVIRLDRSLDGYQTEIARAYSTILGAKAVLRDVGGVSGDLRKPVLDRIMGDDMVTIHFENGIRYKFDVSEIMFSSGNIAERSRMASIECDGETVVDMFAGIGYFSLPLAVYHEPRLVIACELNPVAHAYLVENIRLNGVYGVVKPVRGDNRDLPGTDIADRVIMGYVKTTHEYLPSALKLLKSGGVIHYHETCPTDLLPDRPIERIRSAARGCRVDIERIKEVKSYAPGIGHVVVDARITKPS